MRDDPGRALTQTRSQSSDASAKWPASGGIRGCLRRPGNVFQAWQAILARAEEPRVEGRYTERSAARRGSHTLLPEPGTVADPDVADAMARSFLGRLPSDVVNELLADGERTDYPAGSTIYREGSPKELVPVMRK
jgi:hypothetical protein